MRDEDLKMLRECLDKDTYSAAADDDYEEPNWREPFKSMLETLESGRYHQLTDKQRAWVKGVYEKLFDEPQYLNLVSSGKANLSEYGRTPTPEVLKHLPKRPSGR